MSNKMLLAFTFSALLALPASAQVRTIYVPGIAYGKEVTPPTYASPQYSGIGLESSTHFYNAGTSTAYAKEVQAFSTGGPIASVDCCTEIPAGQSSQLDARISNGFDIGKYELTGDVIATATLQLFHGGFDVNCIWPPYYGSGGIMAQGRIPVPIFEDLFPAGATAVSGDVVPYNIGPPPLCANQEYRRRINVTLFNAGLEPATFTVKVFRAAFSAQPVLTSTYGVPAQSVQQFNSVYSPEHLPADQELQRSPNLWFTITADQPFLSYVSTTFEDPQPGSIQYEIFPSKLR